MLRGPVLLLLLLSMASCSPSTAASVEHPRSRLAKQVEPGTAQEEERKRGKPQRLIAPPPAYGNRVVEALPVVPTVKQTPAS